MCAFPHILRSPFLCGSDQLCPIERCVSMMSVVIARVINGLEVSELSCDLVENFGQVDEQSIDNCQSSVSSGISIVGVGL